MWMDAAVALAYLLLALVKLRLFRTIPVWPSTGVAVAAALLMGDRAWRGVFLGSLLSSWAVAFTTGAGPVTVGSLGVGLGVALGWTLATVASGRALRQVLRDRNPLHSPLDTLRFSLWGVGTYALVSWLIAGTASKMGSTGYAPLAWIVSDFVGAVVVAPVFVAWREAERTSLRRTGTLEIMVTVSLALGVTMCLYSPIYGSLSQDLPVGTLFVLPLFWAAMRLDQRISASLTAACLFIAWYGTAAGYGPLVEVAGPIRALARAARFSGILATILLIVSAMYRERRHVEDALRQSAARLQLALATGRVSVWDWDLRSGAMAWSAEHFSLLGLHPATASASYQTWAARVHPDDLAGVEAAMQHARAERTSYGIDFRVVWPDGSIHWVEARGQFLGTDADQPARMIAAMVDLTERKRVEAALHEVNRQKDEFLAMLGHELRNPLAPIRNATYLLRHSGSVEPRLERFCDMIDRQATHMVRLVDDLLDASRVTSGKIRLQTERVNLSTMVQQAAETVRPLIERKGQTLTLDLSPELIEVEADAARLVQVIANLLDNAAKFTPEHGRISLGTERAGPSATIRIRDTGVGIAPELLPRIFELFVQGTVSLDRAEGGLGIGLPLVHRLVAMHGGHVTAHSAGPGQGSEFVVTWPGLPPLRSAVPGAPHARPPTFSERLRILVVEDNVEVAESLVLVLDLKGHEVRTAYTGFAALTLAPVFAPHVAFIDLGLPGLDGYEVARRLRQQSACQSTLLVALSGYGRPEDKQRAREAGFHHHLTKPVDPSTIEALLADRAGSGLSAEASSRH
jgi:PAS domain S-box-containing protein